MQRRILGLLASSSLVAASAAVAGAAGIAATAPAAAAAGPVPMIRMLAHHSFAAPPTTADCEAALGIACYAPFQYQKAYNLAPLYAKGDNGHGQTIVIVDSFGSPTIQSDLATFDTAFGLPAPPSFSIITPAGTPPAFDPTNPTMLGWAQETSLDVEYSHTIAPGADIVLVETPVAETEGVTGFPQIVQAENYVINHHLGDVITQSFGATEETFPNQASLLRLRTAFVNAARNGVTVLGSSGDGGATDARSNGVDFYLHRVNSWPSSDPLVTSVGGTQMHLDAAGNHLQPDTVWNDTNLLGSPAASGGGVSAVFDRPWYQDRVARTVHGDRGTPDISMSAAVDGGALVYLSSEAAGGPAGFYIIGGTSEASPLFSGIVAIADQYAGHSLGLLNPAIYALSRAHAPGIVDVTAGTNTVTFSQGGSVHTVRGYDAVGGYDLSSGVGTVDAASFVPELVQAVGAGHGHD